MRVIINSLGSQLDTFIRGPRIYSLALLIVFAVGLFLRFGHLFVIDVTLPFQFGGLFAEFADAIAESGYLLPTRIEYYTDGGLPFAYPPIPFYFEALLIHSFGVPTFVTANLLPLVFASAALPLFYWLTAELEMRPATRIAGLAAFATFPPLLTSQVEAAGLAESFGTLATVLLVTLMIRSVKGDDFRAYMFAGIALAIAIGGSPGSAYAAGLTSVIFAVAVISRHLNSPIQGFSKLGVYAITGILLSGPYWIVVVGRHGFGVFIDPFVAEHASLLRSVFSALFDLVRFEYFQVSGAQATFPILSDALIVTGAFWAIFNKKIPLLIWYIFMFNIPREGPWLIAMPASLLIGYAVGEIVLPFVWRVYLRKKSWMAGIVSLGLVIGLLAGYALYQSLASMRYLLLQDQPLTQSAVNAMRWAGDNLPPDARMVVISREQVIEWMPAVSNRTVINTPWGAEWKPGERARLILLNLQLSVCEDFGCIGQMTAVHTDRSELFVYMDNRKLDQLVESNRNVSESTTIDVLFRNDEAGIFRMSLSPWVQE